MEGMAEASPAPGTGGVVALVETGSGAEARNEVSAEHLNINFNNPEVRKKMGLKYFILHYTRLFLCVCTIGEKYFIKIFFFVSNYFAHKQGSVHLKKKYKEKNPKNLQEKNNCFFLFLILLFESFHNMSVAFKTVAWFTV